METLIGITLVLAWIIFLFVSRKVVRLLRKDKTTFEDIEKYSAVFILLVALTTAILIY